MNRGSLNTTQAILDLDPLTVYGAAGFALTRQTVDADTDGNGVADLLGASLTSLALDANGVGVYIDGIANLTVTGKLALATLKPAACWTCAAGSR